MHAEISLEQAQNLILERVSAGPIERIALEQAWGRVLAVDIRAPHSLPAAAQSAVDGYALGDFEAPAGTGFELKGMLKQDEISAHVLRSGESMGVFTGGRLPKGTGAVVPREKTSFEAGRLVVQERVKPGNNIKQAGEDYQEGELLAAAGSILDPGAIALLAAYGYGTVKVYSRPSIAVFSLGANIVPHDSNPESGQVRDSNGPMLAALISQAGGEPAAVEVAATTDRKALAEQLKNLLEQADLVILTGGSYSSEFFEARQVMEAAGAEILYWDVAVQPGSHPGTGYLNGKLLLSLSGNPAACAVGFHLFAAPAIKARLGLEAGNQWVHARCANGFSKAAVTRRLVRGRLSFNGDKLEVEVLAGQKPSMMRSLVKCNALIDIPAGTPPVSSGDTVRVRQIAPI